MKLSDHDLQQINLDWLRERTPEELLHVSQKLLDDLKEARERLNQNSSNSSVPSGSQPPWFHPAQDSENEADDEDTPIPPPPNEKTDDKNNSGGEASAEKSNSQSGKESTEPPEPARKPGKQPGAQGFGRTQILPVTATEHHQACQCTGCGKAFTSDTPSRAYTGFYTIDIEYGEPDKPGIRVTNTLHRYYDTICECGHTTRITPHREPPEALFDGIELREWRLTGPALMSLIVFLSMRMRMSRPRIREFLLLWLGIELGTGTINQCIHESGRSVAPVEDQLVEELLTSDLLHADETTWLIAGKPFWLWVFVTTTVTLYYITFRSNELVRNLLEGFNGWLMSDGYLVYREIAKRLRCWAHLVRKAKGLSESLNQEAAAFGKRAHEVLKTLMDAVYQAREGPPGANLEEEYWALLENFSAECDVLSLSKYERMLDSKHKKARALAVEFLNDWEAIFMVLRYPHLPLTNNEAERMLRHWVIMRKISHGTRSDEGTRVFALLASVIDTCRQRGVSPWRYLEQVIRERRSGRDAPPLPSAPVPVAGG
jgi:hypothetical protein